MKITGNKNWYTKQIPEFRVNGTIVKSDHRYIVEDNTTLKNLVLSSDRSFIERLKSRGETGEEYYSRNPLFFISQYIQDITRYNYKRSVETVLADAFDKLIKSKRFAEGKGTVERHQVIKFVDEALRTLNNVAEEFLARSDLPKEDSKIYACGHPGMIEDVKLQAAQQNWKFIEERFWKE